MLVVDGVEWFPLDEVCLKLNKKIYEIGNCISVDDIRPFNGRLYINSDGLYEMTFGFFADQRKYF